MTAMAMAVAMEMMMMVREVMVAATVAAVGGAVLW